MRNEYLVRIDRVDKTFKTRHLFYKDDTTPRRLFHKKLVQAACSIDFGIRAGEIFGLLGPNGAGKTTTVKMVSGLVRPDRGAVYVDGLNVDKKRLQVLKKVGVVLEGTRTSIWPLTPYENLMYYGNLKDVKGKVLKERAKSLLTFIGLDHKQHVEVRKLSRGEKQKLAICIALIADPPVVLLDEPTTGLDVQSSRNIKDRILEMTREQGKCVLVTTHDMNVAQEICDRIGIIDKGVLVACQPKESLLDVFSDPVFEFRLDRLVPSSILDGIAHINEITMRVEEEGPVVAVALEPDLEARSRALYEVVQRFRDQGVLLRSVSQRQQTLENVFLRLTGKR
ncbi:MAG: ABC transporter ATP-binding protein [Candidatus Hydrogenedentes bacterium]|nr:ABC transporter ATP-binding protein [Candidatus Hydrogenedentota bacterium]